MKIQLFLPIIIGILAIARDAHGSANNRKDNPTTTNSQCINNSNIAMTTLSNRANSLQLKESFNAQMPCNINDHKENNATMKYIKKEWGVTNKYFYGADDISFVDDPFTPNSDYKTLRVLYEKGSFSPQATRRQKNDVSGGAEFYARPFNGTYKRGLLSYEIAFDDGFKWVKGGKLPGLYGGEPTSGCSGGDKADGEKCFSVRMMWRSQGKAEAYAYLPPEDDAVCENSKVICNDEYGTSIGRGLINFTQKKWSKIEIYTVMNDPDQHNGELTVWQDNRTVIDLKGLVFRTQKTLGVSSMLFSTFFGGSSKEYATPIDTYTYFKNIQFSVADPEQSELSNTESAASSPLLISFSSINMVWLITTITAILFCMNFFDQ